VGGGDGVVVQGLVKFIGLIRKKCVWG